jgi:hypothetical protein
MTANDLIAEFEKTWFYTRGITTDFLNSIPEDKWHFSHHSKYAPFSKQFRHMTCVYGVYIEGFKNQAVDFNKKHSHYSGPLDRAAIKADLAKKDLELKEVLKALSSEQVEKFRLDFFGVNMSFTEYSHVLIQHECMHIGTWGNMAAFAGFEVPKSWKSDWGFQ